MQSYKDVNYRLYNLKLFKNTRWNENYKHADKILKRIKLKEV